MTVLVLVEHDGKQVNPATLHAVCAAQKLGEVHALVAGSGSLKVAEQASKINGVSKVLLAEAPHFAELLAEEIAPLVVSLVAPYRYFVAAASAFGKNIMPRIAAMLDCSQISDLTEIVDKQTFIRPTYAGNVFTTVFSNEEKLVLTIRASAFDAATYGEQVAEIKNVAATLAQQLSRFVSRELTQSDRPELTQAKVIVAGGRALGSAEQFDAVLTPLADALGAAIGASRAAVIIKWGKRVKLLHLNCILRLVFQARFSTLQGCRTAKLWLPLTKILMPKFSMWQILALWAICLKLYRN